MVDPVAGPRPDRGDRDEEALVELEHGAACGPTTSSAAPRRAVGRRAGSDPPGRCSRARLVAAVTRSWRRRWKSAWTRCQSAARSWWGDGAGALRERPDSVRSRAGRPHPASTLHADNGMQLLVQRICGPPGRGQPLVPRRLQGRAPWRTRLRTPLRAPDVRGLSMGPGEFDNQLESAGRTTARPPPTAPTTGSPCPPARSRSRCGWSRTAWAFCSRQ
jgi:hypothetical protein